MLRYSVFIGISITLLIESAFNEMIAFPTIPVVYIDDFHNQETKQKFINEVSHAFHTVGFFIAVNPGIDSSLLESVYQASLKFFKQPLNKKDKIHFPDLSGQRGYSQQETAQGSYIQDHKEFFHLGHNDAQAPLWMDLETPTRPLIDLLDNYSENLQQAFALALGERKNFFPPPQGGESVLRTMHYKKNASPNQYWEAPHTDMNLFSILLPSSTRELQVQQNYKWIDIEIPINGFLVICGGKLENLSNGYFRSAWYRVCAQTEKEGYAIAYFAHPRLLDSMDPRPNSISMTGGIVKYPQASSLELTLPRLRELKVASPEFLQMEQDSGILDRIKDLLDRGVASESVIKTYQIWKKWEEFNTE